MKSLAAYAMRGRLQALAVIFGFAVASMMFPPVSILSSALLGLVMLRKGSAESAWVLLLSLLGLGLGGVLLVDDAIPAILYGLLLWLPILPAAAILRESRRLDWALITILALGVTVVIAVYLVSDNPAALWREKMGLFLQSVMDQNDPSRVDAEAMAKALDFFSHYFTGAMVAASAISVIFALLIARWQQAVLFNPGGFRSEFLTMRLQSAVAYTAFAIVAIAVLASGAIAEIAWNLSAVFIVLFIIGGFAVVHSLLGGKGVWIIGVYFVLLISPQLLLPPIALLGLSDVWLDWRQYGNKQR